MLVSNVRPQKVSSISAKFAMYIEVDEYDPIQGQAQEPLKVKNVAIFKGYLLPHLYWGLANDHGFLN